MIITQWPCHPLTVTRQRPKWKQRGGGGTEDRIGGQSFGVRAGDGLMDRRFVLTFILCSVSWVCFWEVRWKKSKGSQIEEWLQKHRLSEYKHLFDGKQKCVGYIILGDGVMHALHSANCLLNEHRWKANQLPTALLFWELRIYFDSCCNHSVSSSRAGFDES